MIAALVVGCPFAAPDRDEVRDYILQVLERNLAIQQIAALQKAGYIPEEIDRITNSDAFKNYLRQVTHSPKVTRSIERKIDQLLSPGYLEARVQRSVELAQAKQQEDWVLALRELERTRARPSKSLDGPEESLFARLLRQFKERLFD